MRSSRRKQILYGMAIIIFAVALFIDKLDIFRGVNVLKIGILLTFICVVLSVNIHKHRIIVVAVTMGLIATTFSKQLGIEKVAPTFIIFVSLLVGIGLSMIFEKKPKKIEFNEFETKKGFDNNCGASSVEYTEGEEMFKVGNTFGERTEYVSVNNLRQGKIENAMGSLTVYLDGSTIDSNGGCIEVSNGLGKLNIYIPSEFRTVIHSDNGFGTVKTHGKTSMDATKPLLNLKVSNGFGSTDIFFE